MVWTAHKRFVSAYREGPLALRHWERLAYALSHADYNPSNDFAIRK